MKFHLYKENEKKEFEAFVTLYLEAETPEGQEDNLYDYLSILISGLVDIHKCAFKYKDEKGRESKVFNYSCYWVDDFKSAHFANSLVERL